jgi:rare lipoprotein A
MLLLIALSAALGGADRHHAATTPAEAPRAGWSQPMQPASAAQDAPPPDMPQGAGPRATSGGQLFDTVAVAQPDDGSAHGIAVAAAGATPGGFVEVTELGGGRTILALVGANQASGGTVLLSAGAFQALGIAPGAGVRVRAALPSPQDQTALRAGGPASARIDAPEVLLKALRKRVPQAIASSPVRAAPAHVQSRPRTDPVTSPPAVMHAVARPTHRDDPVAVVSDTPAAPPAARSQRTAHHAAAPAPVLRSGYIVQVAALSAAARANQLARTLGGRVVGGGGLYRVQLGPYGDLASANRARDGAARRGYRDARVAHTE